MERRKGKAYYSLQLTIGGGKEFYSLTKAIIDDAGATHTSSNL
jgi:hypothetical protein